MDNQVSEDKVAEEGIETGPLSLLKKLWDEWKAWILGPIFVALACVVMTLGCEYASELNKKILERFPLACLLMMPVGFGLFVYCVIRFFNGAQGSGVPQTVAAVADPSPEKKSVLISVRILVGKALLLMGGFFVGGSIGREGPAVQIGASIMHAFYGHGAELTVERRRNLIVAGGAAGIAVAFNAPLAGVIFGIEELSKQFVFKEHTKSAMAVFIAILVAIALMGGDPYFGITDVFSNGLADAHIVIICGALGGFLGGIFARLLVKITTNPPRVIELLVRNHRIYFAAICGITVALIGLLTDNTIFGSGFEQTLHTLHADGSSFAWYYGPAKLLATLLCGFSGIPAGMFAPSISVGAGIGDTLTTFFPGLGSHGLIIILLMASYLTGVVRTPLTAMVIIIEMTAGFHLLLPLFAAVLIANWTSKLVCPVPMYSSLAERFLSSLHMKL